MKRKIQFILAFFLLISPGVIPAVASVHQNRTVGDYIIQCSWVNNPSVVGQSNAVLIMISHSPAGSSSATAIDISELTVSIGYAGQNKILKLQPLSETTPNGYVAPITPTRAGVYTIHLGGKIGDTAFNTNVNLERIQPTNGVQFPVLTNATNTSMDPFLGIANPKWMVIGSLLLAVLAVCFAAIVLARKPDQA